MTRLPEGMPWWRRITRTLATRRRSQGILLWRNIQDRAAIESVPRLARANRAQQMEWVTSVAVTQKALITASATLHPFSLSQCSSRRTEGSRRYLDRVQYR